MPKVHDNDIILQLYARTPAPCRDYCGLTLTHDEVILNVWQVTFGPHVYPKRNRYDISDFVEDKRAQSNIENLFGSAICKYVTSIARNDVNLQNLPTKVFHHLLNYLAAQDILRLSQTSKILFERCESSAVWQMLFRKRLRRKIDSRDINLANHYGWKDYLKTKLCFLPHKRNTNPTTIKPLNNSRSQSKTDKDSIKLIKNPIDVNVKKNTNVKLVAKKSMDQKTPSDVTNYKLKSKLTSVLGSKK